MVVCSFNKNLAFLGYEFAGEGNDESIRDDSYPTCKKSVIITSVTDQGCLSRIRDPNFFHPGSALKNLSILNQKKLFLNSRKYDPGCSSRIQGSKGTRSRIRNTDHHVTSSLPAKHTVLSKRERKRDRERETTVKSCSSDMLLKD
jgi:hypothetical protein